MNNIAYFISPHGLGHAARSAAVMEAIHNIDPSITFEIFTTVSSRFFDESLKGFYNYHETLTDIGLAQTDAFNENIPETVKRLNALLPFDDKTINAYAAKLKNCGCKLVICDIAPMGIRVAKRAGIPSLLIENFTWDWIYEAYFDEMPQLKKHALYLAEEFAEVTYHIRTQPFCGETSADLFTNPVSRASRLSKKETREKLGINESSNVVFISLGGIAKEHKFLDRLLQYPEVIFILSGATDIMENRDNLIFLPPHTDIYHPDLVGASDCVVGKVGYSTVAEVYQAGVPFAYLGRKTFRETKPLTSFIEKEMPNIQISIKEFRSGDWTKRLPDLLSLKRRKRTTRNGCREIAIFVQDLLGSC